MNKKAMIVGVLAVLALTVSVSAFAADGDVTAWQGFWNSVGGFAYNALPWTWGNWMGGRA